MTSTPAPATPARAPFTVRHRKALRITAVVLVAVYLLYLLAANVFLNTQLSVQAFNRKPERFQIHWARAYSLYPGHIHATGLRVWGHARTTRWSATSPVADGRIKLFSLLARRLSFGTIDAHDVVFGVDRTDVDLPPSVPTPRAARRGPWQLHFDGIDTASLQQLRLDTWVIEGGGKAHLVLDKELRGGPIALGQSWLRMPAARVRNGDTLFAEAAKLDLDLSMAPNTRAQAQGARKLRFIDARLQLAGRAPGIGVREEARSGKVAVATTEPIGRITADLTIERGVLKPGGTLRWNAPVTLGSAGNATQGYRLQLDATVRDDGLLLQASVPKRSGREDNISMRLLLAERRVQTIAPRALLQKLSGDISGQWHFNTLRWINPLLSQGWLKLDGAADVAGNLKLRDGQLLPGSNARVLRADVSAEVFETIAHGQASAAAKVEQGRTTVDFIAQQFALAPRTAKGQPYVQGRNLTLRLVGSQELSEFRKTLVATVRFRDARMPDLRAYNRSLPAKSLQFDGGSGTVSADMVLDAAGEMTRGKLQLRGDQARVRLGEARIGGDIALDTRLSHTGKGNREYRIDAFRLGLDNVRVGDAKPLDPPWWARASFEQGTLGWQQPVRLAGNADVVMKDVSALLALYAQRSAFPRWIGGLIDAGQARATAQVRIAGDSVALDRIVASNDRVQLRARLRVADGQTQGAMAAKWGVLAVGVQVQGGERRLKLVNVGQWYDALPALPE